MNFHKNSGQSQCRRQKTKLIIELQAYKTEKLVISPNDIMPSERCMFENGFIKHIVHRIKAQLGNIIILRIIIRFSECYNFGCIHVCCNKKK